MQYGYFDTQNREYVITRPDTPAPWANYLGSTEYGAIISGNAGGYSFAGSGANGRILRYRFNSFDQPGRYIYLRDQESGDFWSVSWMPVRKPLERFCSVCRHGMGYTVITGDYAEIHAETAYYVPVHGRHEVWRLTVRNDSARPRHLMAAGFAELTSEPNYEQDLVNLQYSQFITGTELLGHGVRQVINGNMIPGNTVDGKVPSARLFAMEGAEISGWCGDRDAFLGPCRDYSAPIAIETGRLGNVGNYGGNSCGAIAAELTLAPGEERTLVFLLGLEQDYGSMEALCAPYENPAGRCKEELAALRSLWEARLSGLQVRTPSPEFNEMVNTWNAYQCYITFLWSRAASFQYCGMRNGYGYRDTVQDIQGILHLDPALGRERLVFMLSAQMHHGAGLPLVKYSHTPGAEDGPESDAYVRETGHPSYRADDALWLFPTVYKYVCETGDTAFLRQAVPFADRGSGTVFEHLRRALDFSRTHLGIHGLPAGLWADWNDCLRLGEDGASVFVAMQLYGALGIQACFAGLLGEDGYAGELQAARAALGDTIQSLCWDQDRFIRGFTEDGAVIGGRQDPEASLWLNPQSWSVISGLATDAQAETALELVESQLMTGFGAALGKRRHLLPEPGLAHAGGGAGGPRKPGLLPVPGDLPRGHERQGGDPEDGTLLPRAVHRGAPEPSFRTKPRPLAHRHRIYRHGGVCGGNPRTAAGAPGDADLPLRSFRLVPSGTAQAVPGKMAGNSDRKPGWQGERVRLPDPQWGPVPGWPDPGNGPEGGEHGHRSAVTGRICRQNKSRKRHGDCAPRGRQSPCFA